jgi:predicted heme/steroid binding protein
MPLKDAAAVLGVSKDAVRQRVRRDTLRSDKGEDGRVYVYLDASVDDVHGPPAREAGDDPLHQQMQARIDDLREQLRREQDAHEQTRRLLGGALERIPAIEAPTGSTPDAPGPPSGGEDTPGRGTTPGDRERPAQRPSWWRRFWR